jgi:hypothetical protein
MPKQIPISEVATGFRFLLTETFESVQVAYLDRGTSLFETLAEISAEGASQPMGDCATVAAHVAHTRYYLEVLEDRMFGRDHRPHRKHLRHVHVPFAHHARLVDR